MQLYTGSKSEIIRNPSTESSNCIQNLDESGANRPTLDDGMIAVYYDNTNGVWRKADENNSDSAYQWYDYDNKMWANVVLVDDYTLYEESSLGEIINDDDIVAFYVWIPRYKYKVWNIDGDSSNKDSYLSGISIEFEYGKGDSGSISCTSDTCVGNNGEWLTHPAFTLNNLKGFWIAKYVIRDNSNLINISNNGSSLTNYSYSNALSISNKFLEYGISKYNIDILSNLEWGAVIYLNYSSYSDYLSSGSINIYGVYDMFDSVDEMVVFDGEILGSALYEMGNKLDTYNNIIYRSGMVNISNTSKNYEFRNVLYQE